MKKQKLKDAYPAVFIRVLGFWMLFTLFFTQHTNASASPLSYAQGTKLSLKIMDKPLEDVLEAVKAQSEFSFVVNRSEVDLGQIVSIDVRKKTIMEILNMVLEGKDLSYEVNGKHIFIYKTDKLKEVVKPAQPAQRHIIGIVADAAGEPVIGATVLLSGTTKGTATDVDGKFELDVPDTDVALIISSIGYVKRTVEVARHAKQVDVVLEEDTKQIEEVVVVGFGVQKKETVTGAISMLQTRDLVQSPQANVSNMLGGRMPGLLAVQRSGEPGADQSTLRIRGIGTFATGSDSQDPLIMVDGIETANYNNIDPNEIESLSILKDASATAVYGVRGANGVILITTKRGAEGKPQISYSGNFAINKFTDIRETMNAYDYTRLANEGRKYDAYITGGYTEKYKAADIEKFRTGEDPIFYPDVDWYDLMLKPSSFTTQHNINVSGGAKRVKYFISGGYYNQQGLFKPTSLLEGYNVQSAYERFNFRSNLDFQVTERLTMKLNIASQMETRTGNAGETARLMDIIARANPIATPGVVDGKIVDLGTSVTNPLINFYQNGYRNEYRNYLNGSFHLNYKLDPWVKGMALHGTVSYENYYRMEQKYTKTSLMRYSIRKTPEGGIAFQPLFQDTPFTYSPAWGKNRRTYVEFGINYDRTFAQDHKVTALALYNQSRRVDPDLEYKIPNSYQGLVGRVTYGYKNKYLAEFNAGYNGTENFAEGKRYGFFPAYSLGWVVSEESFFPKSDIVPYLKLRASYGEVGNDRIGGSRFLYLPTAYQYLSGGDNYYYFGEVGSTYAQYRISAEGKMGNPNLTWERAKKTDIGGEISFWKHKIKINLDYFIEKRDNILANPNTTPALFGGTMPAYNLGKMKNSGWDGDITYRDNVRDFNYWVRGTFTYAHNVIEYQDEVKRPFSYQNRTGQMAGQYFGLICDGIYNTWDEVNNPNRPKSSWQNDKIQPGDLIYRDINGDGIINNDDQVPIGYSNFPEIVYGISFGGGWKGIDFSVLFQGAEHVSLQYSRYYMYGFGEDFSAPKSLLNSWSQERYEQGLPIDFPHLSEGSTQQKHNYQASTFWTRDAGYLRLKNVELGYNFNMQWLQKLHISSLRVFVNGSNLYTWANMFQGVDPEMAQQSTNYEPYPVTKIFNIGLNVRF